MCFHGKCSGRHGLGGQSSNDHLVFNLEGSPSNPILGPLPPPLPVREKLGNPMV